MSDETIVFAGNHKQSVLLALVSAAFVCLIYFTGDGSIWTYVGVAFFGLGLLVSLYTLLPGTVRLKIDRSGIEMKTFWKPMKLSWSDVDEFYVAHTPGTKMIGIKFSESYKELKTGRKISAGLTGMEGGLPDHFNRSAEEICQVLNSYKRKYSD